LLLLKIKEVACQKLANFLNPFNTNENISCKESSTLEHNMIVAGGHFLFKAISFWWF